MSELERQLRDIFNGSVGEPPRRVTVAAVRRRVTRRRSIEVVAASAAAVLLVGFGLAVASKAAGHNPAAGAGLPAGVPHYYVQQSYAGMNAPLTTKVRSTATGAVTDTVRCPWGSPRFAGQIVPTAPGSFFFICQKSQGSGASPTVTASRIYRFRVDGSGRVQRYTLIPGGTLGKVSVGEIAASADESHVAISTNPAGSPPGRAAAEIVVIDTRTGKRAVWQTRSSTPGGTGSSRATWR